MTVAFDSCILIAGIQEKDHRKEFITRCGQYLQKLQKDKTKIILPAPAVWELMAGYPAQKVPDVARVVQKCFRTAPFNLHAAEIAAKIQIAHGVKVVANETGKKPRANSSAVLAASRQHVKVDIAVLATAIAAHAEQLVTDDGKEFDKFTRWAQGWPITIINVPKGDPQKELPFE
jgi:predicted nucleic acid-binding protein